MTKRAYNFNAGPAALPLEVLQQAQEEFVDFRGIGMSIMEISHRSKEYEQVNDESQSLVKELLGVPDGYQVLFLQGGASTQFAMIPMNFLKPGTAAGYVLTGSWADKAAKEAKGFGEIYVAASGEASGFRAIPAPGDIEVRPDAAYVHITSNETIAGSQYAAYPDTGSVPLIGDLSSDIMCRPIDVSKFDFIYAGAQKNLGPSGVTVVIARDELLQASPKHVPTMLRYDTHAKSKSLYNTPPVYSVYIVNLVLKWIKSHGGLEAMERMNRDKTKLIYDAIDGSGGFYRGLVEPGSRSIMNITFALGSEELEKRFIQESEKQGFVGLKGHRDVGHLRASTYNAVPYESCKALADFMNDFRQRNG
ncbi:3-phosphoserine/phosphohydroxythreonine transaminase [Paenibacillus flagellatus]|uniref:Phosphoserine aminotransferase n=1 Tax=Paenibacillus flagellatus TaxID=2211139 RepID=A0A2V5KCQ2_9BACL|nr:3-phosphoserine/phosphohydroxythreonine transaminase [Paenibacillus flagellatus]PYI57391.1 3-phosphoserine/phosphohydroxythreonine transaminase [Paenibacillus flagellatus]